MDKKSARRSVGLEIDTGSIRAVELSGKSGTAKLTNLGSITLPKEAVKEGLVLQQKVVGSALKELWARAGLKERNVLLGVSNQGVLVRYITIPKVSPDKIRNAINFQAEERLPLSLSSVVLDYIVLGETEGTGEAPIQLEILLVAARRDMLDIFLEALSIANLEAIDIDVSSIAMMHLLPQKVLGMTVALVNIANGLNSILISVNGKPYLSRLGMVKINDLAEGLGCSLEDVFSSRMFANGESKRLLENWINNLASEVRSSINYYQDQTQLSRVEGVLLSGRGALFEGISVQLESYLNLPVRVFNPLQEHNPSKRRLLNTDREALEYTISAGLAQRGLEG